MERLQKVIASRGITSRRKAEQLILKGLVTVNGRRVTELGTKVDPVRDVISVEGRNLPAPPEHIYLLFYKPREVVTTLSDPEGRVSVASLLPRLPERVYPVGRLDYHSEGLLLFTNDGDLANKVMHPSGGLPRTYLVKVKGFPDVGVMNRLRQGGIKLDDGPSPPAEVEYHRELAQNSWLKVTVGEGRNRLVRRMMDAVGHPVARLIRISLGPLKLGELAPGEHRFLTAAEVHELAHYTPQSASRRPRRPKTP